MKPSRLPAGKFVFIVGEKDQGAVKKLETRVVDRFDVLKDLGPHEFLYYVKAI